MQLSCSYPIVAVMLFRMDTATATADSPRDLLKQRGLRATRRRVTVLQALLDASAPLRAAALLERVDGLDRATLYRTLNRLVDVGLVRVVVELGGARRFAAVRRDNGIESSPIRFHCTDCGQDLGLPDPSLRVSIDLPRWSPAIERARIQVTLTGVCPDCSAVEAA